jgi:hypothetical protein
MASLASHQLKPHVEKEKNMTHNESWTFDRELAACFGPSVNFASNPFDRDHAFELLCLLRRAGIGWNEVRRRIQTLLRGGEPGHIQQQLDKAEEMLRLWLID